MPTYEYACKSCGEHIEVVQSFKDDPLTDCPNCGGVLRKVFGSIGIAFKGSGFYRTDSRTPAKDKASAGEKKAAAGSEAKADPKSDSKTDSKTDSKAGGADRESKPKSDKAAASS